MFPVTQMAAYTKAYSTSALTQRYSDTCFTTTASTVISVLTIKQKKKKRKGKQREGWVQQHWKRYMVHNAIISYIKRHVPLTSPINTKVLVTAHFCADISLSQKL